MYTKSKLIAVLNIINKTILIGSIIQIIFGISDILSLTLHYWGDWFTITHAKSTPSAVFNICSGILLTVVALFFIKKINDARFYSSYFECDLDGVISFKELADVTGKSVAKTKTEFSSIMLFLMKRYTIVATGKDKHIELYSKTCLCSCTHCGAQIEKKEYFTGICPYCGGLDLYARVLTDNSFYSITTDNSIENKAAEYYQAKKLRRKSLIALTFASLATMLILIIFMYACSTVGKIVHYDEYISDYYHGVLFEGKEMKDYGSIKRERFVSNVVYSVGFILCQSTILTLCIYIILNAVRTQKLSNYLAICKKPFLKMAEIKKALKIRKPFEQAYTLIRNGYLKNATFEKHSDGMKLAMAKKIQKDICPHCGAPITGAVNENYICAYCKQMIMSVVVKK